MRPTGTGEEVVATVAVVGRPDAGEVGLEPGMYDRIGTRTGKEREAHPMSQLQDEATHSKLVSWLVLPPDGWLRG